ncbi:MAG: hypothetical protein J4O08_06020, partial [Chloroflexi bacterium]|nr:hypothetical protein [Chloroflexota bacterium]
VPGLRVTLEHDPYNYLTPHTVLQFTPEWRGPDRNVVWQAMADGDPPVYLHNIHNPDELAVDAINLDDEELGIVITRLREELMG